MIMHPIPLCDDQLYEKKSKIVCEIMQVIQDSGFANCSSFEI